MNKQTRTRLAPGCPWPRSLVLGRLRDDQARRDPAAPVESRSATAGGAAGTARRRRHRRGTPQSQRGHGRTWPRQGAAGGASAAMAAPSQRIVYFDFDSFVIKDEFKGMLDGHAKALTASRGKRMVIEGHTDERGGREYNLALGQKRAEAVRALAAAAGRRRTADRGRELRRGAPGGAGQRRSGLGAQPARRTEGPLTMRAALLARAALLSLALGLAGRRRRRRRCSTTRRRARPSSTCANASRAERRAVQGAHRRARGRQCAADRAAGGAAPQPARPEQPARGPARRDRQAARQRRAARARAGRAAARQKDMAQALDERLRKLEPVKVTLDGREFRPSPPRRRPTTKPSRPSAAATSTRRRPC